MKVYQYLLPYGQSVTIHISINDLGTGGYKASPVLASGDAKVSKNGGAESNLATLPSVDGTNDKQVNVQISSSEMQTARLRVRIEDQTVPAEWEPVEILIDTYGDPSSAHPNLGKVMPAPSVRYP